jgi:hypothetical protein
MLTAEQRRSRASLASLAARASKDPAAAEAVEEARREYRYISAAEYVRQLLSARPPLTDDQRDALASMLRGEAR